MQEESPGVPEKCLYAAWRAPRGRPSLRRHDDDSALFDDRKFTVPIRIADDLFGPDEYGILPNTRIIVVTAAPRDAVVSALAGTARRWMRITDTGDEISGEVDEEAFYDKLEQLRDEQGREDWDLPYTPNYVSPVILGPLGPEIVADCKDGMTPEMANAVLRALREELARFGIDDAEIRSDGPPPDFDRILAEIW